MVGHADPFALRAEIAAAFPGVDMDSHPIEFGPIHLRFELGDKHPNGSDERIVQATERAATIFGETFLGDEQLTLIIKNWDWAGREIWPSTPGYLASLISFPGQQVVQIITQNRESGGEYSNEQVFLRASVRDLDFRTILQGIAHREQGRQPRINESIYFVCSRLAVAFYMYDDRGCLLFAGHAEKLRALYLQRHVWLVDPDSPDWETMLQAQ